MTSPAPRFSPSRPCSNPRETPELLAWRDLFESAAWEAGSDASGVVTRRHVVACQQAWTVRVTRVPVLLPGRQALLEYCVLAGELVAAFPDREQAFRGAGIFAADLTTPGSSGPRPGSALVLYGRDGWAVSVTPRE